MWLSASMYDVRRPMSVVLAAEGSLPNALKDQTRSHPHTLARIPGHSARHLLTQAKIHLGTTHTHTSYGSWGPCGHYFDNYTRGAI